MDGYNKLISEFEKEISLIHFYYGVLHTIIQKHHAFTQQTNPKRGILDTVISFPGAVTGAISGAVRASGFAGIYLLNNKIKEIDQKQVDAIYQEINAIESGVRQSVDSMLQKLLEYHEINMMNYRYYKAIYAISFLNSIKYEKTEDTTYKINYLKSFFYFMKDNEKFTDEICYQFFDRVYIYENVGNDINLFTEFYDKIASKIMASEIKKREIHYPVLGVTLSNFKYQSDYDKKAKFRETCEDINKLADIFKDVEFELEEEFGEVDTLKQGLIVMKDKYQEKLKEINLTMHENKNVFKEDNYDLVAKLYTSAISSEISRLYKQYLDYSTDNPEIKHYSSHSLNSQDEMLSADGKYYITYTNELLQRFNLLLERDDVDKYKTMSPFLTIEINKIKSLDLALSNTKKSIPFTPDDINDIGNIYRLLSGGVVKEEESAGYFFGTTKTIKIVDRLGDDIKVDSVNDNVIDEIFERDNSIDELLFDGDIRNQPLSIVKTGDEVDDEDVGEEVDEVDDEDVGEEVDEVDDEDVGEEVDEVDDEDEEGEEVGQTRLMGFLGNISQAFRNTIGNSDTFPTS
jgi:hypothetical protein